MIKFLGYGVSNLKRLPRAIVTEEDLETTVGPGVPWRRTFRDPISLLAIGVAVVLSLPYFAPGLSAAWKTRYAFFFDSPLLVLTVVACLLAFRAAEVRAERRFWGIFSLAFTCWVLVRLFEAVLPNRAHTVEVNLVQDLFYLGFYLLFLLALEQWPHECAPTGSKRRVVRQMQATGSITFAFGLLVYLSLIPGALDPSSFLSLVPSTIFYVVLDGYLLLRTIALHSNTTEPGWRRLYAGLLITTGLFLTLDLLDLASRLGSIAHVPAGSPLESLWLLPNVTMIVTARFATWRDRSRQTAPAVARDPFSLLWRGRLVYYALALPALHLVAETAGFLNEETRTARQLWVVASLAVMTSLAVIYDRRLEAERRNLEEDHRRMAEQLEMSQRMDAVRRLAGGVAHDFNNMLTVIRGYAELLLAELPTEGTSYEGAEQIAQAAGRAASLTSQLVAMSRRPSDERGSFSPSKAISEAKPMLEHIVDADLDLRLDLVADDLFVQGEEAAFDDALVNLTLNARDATPAGGWIAIKTTRRELGPDEAARSGIPPGSYGVIEISDSGCGMDEKTRRHVFEPFFTTKSSGNGLGLAMVYSFANEAGGAVGVSSLPGLGTRFRLLLPVADPPPSPAPEIVAPNCQPLSGHGTVMVVEDEVGVRAMVRSALVAAGFEVLTASNGRDALELIEKEPGIDLVLSDLVMPVLGGAELAEQLRQKASRLPFVFMTGYSANQLDRLGTWARTAPILNKPFATQELLDVVRQAIQGSDSGRRPGRQPAPAQRRSAG